MKRTFVLVSLAFVVVSLVITAVVLEFCGLAPFYWALYWFHGDLWPAQEAMVRSGYTLIPQARQIDSIFGPAWHQVCNYTEPDTVEWQSTTQIAGKYELTMVVSIEIDRHSGAAKKVLNKPQFVLARVVAITLRPDGTVGSISYGESYSFDLVDWKKLVAAKGDFSAIGIQLVSGKPVANIDTYQKSPRNGLRMVGPNEKAKP